MTRSFLKWAGGKHRVADALIEIVSNSPPFNIRWDVREGERYHEPMLGSGSMFFRLSGNDFFHTRRRAQLGDVNHILICAMTTISDKKNMLAIIHQLTNFQTEYPLDKPHPNPRGQEKSVRQKRMFYLKRNRLNELSKKINFLSNDEKIELTCLAIFLNKTCYNGLWRMNSKGEFNTPEGSYNYPKNICQEQVLMDCQVLLKKSSLHCRDWREGLREAKRGDLVYLDPPYMPLKVGDNVFTNYFTAGFSLDDQIELARMAAMAAKRGVRIIASNHDAKGNPNVRRIYNEASKLAGIAKPEIVSIDVTRTISCKGQGRVKVNEVLIFLANNDGE